MGIGAPQLNQPVVMGGQKFAAARRSLAPGFPSAPEAVLPAVDPKGMQTGLGLWRTTTSPRPRAVLFWDREDRPAGGGEIPCYTPTRGRASLKASRACCTQGHG